MIPTVLQETVQAIRTLTEEQLKDVLAYVRKIGKENGEDKSIKPKKKIWEEIEEIMKDIPKEAWEGMPTDGSLNHDHYLYGAPKRKS